MKDNALELFALYDTLTEYYYGPLRSSATEQSATLWAWRLNADQITPLNVIDLGNICLFSNGHKDLYGKDMENIIVVPINHDILNFTNSIPLTEWKWRDEERDMYNTSTGNI